MAQVIVTLRQLNSEEKAVFSTQKTINVREGAEIQDLACDVAEFCKDTRDVQNNLKKVGLNVSLIRKTLPMSIHILFSDDETECSINVRNFGKWVDEKPIADIRKGLELMTEYGMKHGF